MLVRWCWWWWEVVRHLAKGVRKVARSEATMASHREAEVTHAPGGGCVVEVEEVSV